MPQRTELARTTEAMLAILVVAFMVSMGARPGQAGTLPVPHCTHACDNARSAPQYQATDITDMAFVPSRLLTLPALELSAASVPAVLDAPLELHTAFSRHIRPPPRRSRAGLISPR